MSTRCNILIGNNQFYHHHDGYPNGVGMDLAYFLANVNDGKLGPWAKNTDEIAKYITQNNGITGRLGEGFSGKDREYEAENPGLHSDIEFLYLINGRQGDFHLYCVDVWDYIEKHPAKGERWNHPFFKLDPHRLQANFCTPEYEMKIPSSDVPEDERVYRVEAVITHKEAKSLGLNRELEYGRGDLATGIVRVRNAKAKGFIGVMTASNGKQVNTPAFPTQRDVARFIDQYTTAHRILDYRILPATDVHKTTGFRDPTAVKGVDVAYVSRNRKGQKVKERPAFFGRWRRSE